MILRFIIFFFIILNCSAYASEQHLYEDDFSKITLLNDKDFLAVKIDLAKGYNINWHSANYESASTKIDLITNHNFDYKVFYPVPYIDKNNKAIYKNQIIIPIKIIAPKVNELFTLLNIKYVVCGDICVPIKKEFKIKFNINSKDSHTKAIINKALEKVTNFKLIDLYKVKDVKLLNKNNKNFLIFDIVSDKNINDPKVYVRSNNYIEFAKSKIRFLDNKRKIKIITEVKKLSQKIINPIEINFILQDKINNFESSLKIKDLNFIPTDDQFIDYDIWLILFYALLGGFILNFMPCVLPVLSIKLTTLLSVKKSYNLYKTILWTVAGILFSFLIIAIVTIIIRNIGLNVGFGLHFQNPHFLITIILVTYFAALSYLDLFYLQVPSFINCIIPKIDNYKGSLKSFFTGVLTTFLATPCIAPFLGVAVGFALTAEELDIIIIFLFIALGLSLPYFLVLLFPSALHIFPKQGRWLIIFKKILAILLFLSMLWFLYILSKELGYKSALVVFLMCVLIKFIIENKDTIFKFANIKLVIIIIFIGLIYYLPIKIFVEKNNEEKIFDEFWQEFNEYKLHEAINAGKVVIVDITADWCITCKANNAINFNDINKIKFYKENNIIGMRANIISDIPADVYKFMINYNRYGIPVNVIFGPQAKTGILMPEIYYPKKLKLAIEAAR